MTSALTDQLALLYRVSQTFNSSLDLNEVLTLVMDEVIAALRAERGFLMLREDGGALVFRSARGMNQQTIDAPEFQISRGVVERVAREGVPILTGDAQSDSQLSIQNSVMMLGLRSILCVPLQLKGKVLGVIYVDNNLFAGIFSKSHLELLTAIAASAAIAIENARLYQLAVEKGRMERELQLARDVQAGLLPRSTPDIPGWQFAAWWKPAREVAGDYYDFIFGEGGRIGLVIADVTDKGMPAALFMALTRSVVRASSALPGSAADCLNYANRLICADSANGMFVTLFYGQLDPATGELTYVNAGHNPPLLYRAAAGELNQLRPTGAALGVDESFILQQRVLTLDPGDTVLLFTDGATEAMDKNEQFFGQENLERVLWENRDSSAEKIIAAFENALREHIGDTAPYDDITLMVIKRL